MISLFKILSEIKMMGKITPEMVEKLYDDIIDIELSSGRSHGLSDILSKYKYFDNNDSFDEWIRKLPKNSLSNFYSDLLQLKNG